MAAEGYDALLFDSDGVLVTFAGPEVIDDGVRAAFAGLGVDDPDPDDVAALRAGVTPDVLESVCASYDLDPAAFWERRDRHTSLVQQRAMREGDKRLYGDARAAVELDRPTGVVSSNQHSTVAFALERFGIDEHVDTFYGREPTTESLRLKKPDPHYLERALADLGGPGRALFVGDSESDVEAAHNAGIDSAFVRRSHRAHLTLSVEPTHEFDDLHALPGLLGGERS